MTHEEIQDLLEPYVDETLDRERRRVVDAHLATCVECRAILDEVAPVDLGLVEPSAWAPRHMRRAVRRSLLRVAVDAVLLLIAATLVAWLLSLLVLHPLVINRGGRAEAATIATADLAVMLNPGASVTGYGFQSHLLARTSEVTVVLPVGSDIEDLGTFESRIGPFAFGGSGGGTLIPFLASDEAAIGGEERLDAVPDGTVATVRLSFETPMDLAAAQALLASDADVRVVWAGFSVGVLESRLTSAGLLGYGTCGQMPIEVSGTAGASGGGSGTGLGDPASIDRALGETVRALVNLIDHPDLLEGIGATKEEAEAAFEALDAPRVAALVATGPTDQIRRFIDEADPDAVGVLAIDFTNWFQPLCGR